MRSYLIGGWLCLVVAGLLAFPAISHAGERKIEFSAENFYMMSLFTGTRDSIQAYAVYCPINGDVVPVTAFGMTKQCPNTEDMAFGVSNFGYQFVEYQDHISGVPNMFLSNKKRASYGRMVMNRIGGKTIRARGPVYYFDARPGTIVVIPMKRQDGKEALDSARAALKARGYGSEVDKFKFELIRAAMIDCGKESGTLQCRLGEDIPYFKIITIPIIIPF